MNTNKHIFISVFLRHREMFFLLVTVFQPSVLAVDGVMLFKSWKQQEEKQGNYNVAS